ncbi:serine O-acetyltransferase EpsC [Fibrobacterota bacterium]
MEDWINKALPEITSQLEKNIKSGVHVETEGGLNISGRQAIYDLLDDMLSALFPSVFSAERVPNKDLNFFLGDVLRHVCYKLSKVTREVLEYHCAKNDCDDCDCENIAEESTRAVMKSLPEIRVRLTEDISSAYEGDPAAGSADEILLGYPCIEAIATYRIAHVLYEMEIPIIPRIMAERAHSKTGIDIHPGARIGKRFFIDHGTGVVIGETCTIGNNVKLYQGVTLGALSPFDKDGKPLKGKKRHPDIQDDVIIYANATILGGETVIGKGSIIGGNTWITRSVPPGEVVYNKNK